MKTGTDTTAPLCAILFPRGETSEAGPLAIWEPDWLNQGRGHNGERAGKQTLGILQTCHKDKSKAMVRLHCVTQTINK